MSVLGRTSLVVAGLVAALVTTGQPASAEVIADSPRWVAVESGPGGSDQARSVAVDPRSGNVTVVGTVDRATDGLVASVVTYDRAGQRLWQRTYPTPRSRNSQARGVLIDPADGTIHLTVVLSIKASGPADTVVVSYSPQGRLIREARITEPDGYLFLGLELDLDVDGQLHLRGTARAIRGDAEIFFSATVDAGVDVRWTASFDDPLSGLDDWAVNPVTGSVYVYGRLADDTVVVAYDEAGEHLWSANLPTYRTDDIAVDATSGTVYVTGHLDDYPRPYRYQTVAYDEAGTRLWTRQEPGNFEFQSASRIAVDRDSGTVVVASSPAVDTDGQPVLILTRAYSPTGRPLWRTAVGGPVRTSSSAPPLSLALDPVTASAHVVTTNQDQQQLDYIALASFGSRGELRRTAAYTDGYEDAASDVAVDPRTGDIYIAAYNDGPGLGQGDWVTLAYRPVA